MVHVAQCPMQRAHKTNSTLTSLCTAEDHAAWLVMLLAPPCTHAKRRTAEASNLNEHPSQQPGQHLAVTQCCAGQHQGTPPRRGCSPTSMLQKHSCSCCNCRDATVQPLEVKALKSPYRVEGAHPKNILQQSGSLADLGVQPR